MGDHACCASALTLRVILEVRPLYALPHVATGVAFSAVAQAYACLSCASQVWTTAHACRCSLSRVAAGCRSCGIEAAAHGADSPHACSFRSAADEARAEGQPQAVVDRIVAEAQAAAADVLTAVRSAPAAAPPLEAAPGSALVPQAGAAHHHHGRTLLRQRLQALAGSPLESGGPVRAFHSRPGLPRALNPAHTGRCCMSWTGAYSAAALPAMRRCREEE